MPFPPLINLLTKSRANMKSFKLPVAALSLCRPSVVPAVMCHTRTGFCMSTSLIPAKTTCRKYGDSAIDASKNKVSYSYPDGKSLNFQIKLDKLYIL